MIRNLFAFPLVLLAVALFPCALLVHGVNATLLDRGFAASAAPAFLASAGELASHVIAAKLKRDHGAVIDRAAVRELFRGSVTDGTVEAFVDALYRELDRAAESGRLRVDLSFEPLARGLASFHERLVREVVLPALPKGLPPGTLEKLDVDIAGGLPARLTFDLGALEANPLAVARWYYRNRGLASAAAFTAAALPLLPLFLIFAGRPAGALRWCGFTLLACASGVGIVCLLAYQALRFYELEAFVAVFGYGGILDPLWTGASLLLAPVKRAGFACLFLGLFCYVVAAGVSGAGEAGSGAAGDPSAGAAPERTPGSEPAQKSCG